MAVKGKFVPVNEEKLAKYQQAIHVARSTTKEDNVLAKPMLWLIRCYRLLRDDWEKKKEDLWEKSEFEPMYEEQKQRADRLERLLRELIRNVATTRDDNLQKRAFQILGELDANALPLTKYRKLKA